MQLYMADRQSTTEDICLVGGQWTVGQSTVKGVGKGVCGRGWTKAVWYVRVWEGESFLVWRRVAPR